MGSFVARRVGYSIPVLLVASILVFVFVRQTSDPLASLRASRDPTLIQRERHRLGLDKPLTTQYVRWAKDFVRGKWGESEVSRRSVGTEIRSKFWNTLQLIVWGMVLSALVAIAIGVYSASRQYSALDYTFTGLSFLGLSMPVFWFGLIAIQLLVFEPRQIFHLAQPIFYSVGLHSAVNHGYLDYFRHLALPVLTLSVQLVAGWSRYQRSSMVDVVSAPPAAVPSPAASGSCFALVFSGTSWRWRRQSSCCSSSSPRSSPESWRPTLSIPSFKEPCWLARDTGPRGSTGSAPTSSVATSSLGCCTAAGSH